MTQSDEPETTDRKPDLRRDFRRQRRIAVGKLADRAAPEAAMARLLSPLLAGRGIIASYAAHGTEIDPRFVSAVSHDLAFPRVDASGLQFHACAPTDLAPGFAGIPEPPAATPRVDPAVILVPLVAATPAGIRLGQGGGFYDRVLARLRAQGPALAIGLAWDIQITFSLPADPWDERLDWIATPTRLVECARFR